MNKLIEKIKNRISEISEPIRPVGWSKKIEVVETKAVLDIIHEEAEAYNEVKTNADYIRNMTDEELAKAISRNNTCVRCNIREYCHENIKCRNCVDAVLDWLKAEREG